MRAPRIVTNLALALSAGPAPLRILALVGAASAAATAQTTYEWRRAEPVGLTFGDTPRITFDTTRRRLVAIFGLADIGTWLGDGSSWRHRAPFPAMTLSQPGFAFHQAFGVAVLFGGQGFGPNPVTRAFDGTTWATIPTTTTPPARWFGPMVYDSARALIVLQGGETQAGAVNDTWEFDGTNWTQRFPATPPSCYSRHGLAYDEARGVTVLHGGLTQGLSQALSDTWEWNGIDWTQRTPTQVPPARRNHGMAYDARRARTVVFGGYLGSTGPVTDTWEYDGVRWQQVAVGGAAPPAMIAPALTYDPDRAGVVAVSQVGGRMLTWLFDGTSWRVTLPDEQPFSRDQHAMAHDPVRGETVMFGEGSASFSLPTIPRTWVHRSGAWFVLDPPVQPPFLQQPAMAHDPVGTGVLLFGGRVGSLAASNATWRFVGHTWQALQPATVPPARSGAAMATDTVRNRIVMFGGEAGLGGWLGDTWEWDGSTWLLRTPPRSPPPREGHTMAFDPVRNTTVLFGGGDQMLVPTLGDQWLWNGTTWTQVLVPLPSPRSHASMVYDPQSQTIRLFGGQFLIASAFGTARHDIWDWDGSTWTQIANPPGTPPPRRVTVMAHDPTLGRTVLFGGETDPHTWLFGPSSRAASREYGAGCDGTFGVPALRALGEPFVGNRGFALRLSAMPAAATALLALSTQQANVPLAGGCTALVAPQIWRGGTASPLGGLDLPVPIPALAALRGVDVFAQTAVLDPNGALGALLSLSPGLQVTLD